MRFARCLGALMALFACSTWTKPVFGQDHETYSFQSSLGRSRIFTHGTVRSWYDRAPDGTMMVALNIACFPGFRPVSLVTSYQGYDTHREFCIPENADVVVSHNGRGCTAQTCRMLYSLKEGGKALPLDHYSLVAVQLRGSAVRPLCLPVDPLPVEPVDRRAIDCGIVDRSRRNVLYPAIGIKVMWPKSR